LPGKGRGRQSGQKRQSEEYTGKFVDAHSDFSPEEFFLEGNEGFFLEGNIAVFIPERFRRAEGL
jgi:hypothetical protein